MDRLITKEENFYVEVINKAEERQVGAFINDLNKIMGMFGYNLNVKTLMNEEKSKQEECARKNTFVCRPYRRGLRCTRHPRYRSVSRTTHPYP